MQKDSKLFDDMARMMSGAAGTFFDAKRELEQQIAAQMEKFLLKMNFVSREEFEVVRDMARKAREENEALKARLDTLEKDKS
jgi:BMFP domain-containing protein YqiC